jgi:hypothetical protein
MKYTNRSCSFIKDKDLASSYNSSSKGYDLPLTQREVTACARHGGVERYSAFVVLPLQTEQASSLQSIVEYSIVVLTKRIKVMRKRTAHKLRLLRYDGNIRPECIKINRISRDAIVVNSSTRGDHAEKRKRQRRFSRSSPSHNTDSFSRLDFKREVV